MGIFPELNKRKTIANVKEYFEKDFPRLRARSHMNLSSLQSPQFDSVSSHSNINTQENNIISSIQAQEYVKETYDIINKSPRIYKIILKNRSLLHFAEMFQGIYDLNDYSYTDNDLKRV